MPVSLLVFVLVFAGLFPSSASGQAPASGTINQINGQESYDLLTYHVGDVLTREDRMAIARTGEAIEEIGAGYVIVRAMAQEARQTEKLGYPIEQLLQSDDFTPVDAALPRLVTV